MGVSRKAPHSLPAGPECRPCLHTPEPVNWEEPGQLQLQCWGMGLTGIEPQQLWNKEQTVAEKLPNVNTESFSSQQPRGKGERSRKESKRAERGLREAGPD